MDFFLRCIKKNKGETEVTERDLDQDLTFTGWRHPAQQSSTKQVNEMSCLLIVVLQVMKEYSKKNKEINKSINI